MTDRKVATACRCSASAVFSLASAWASRSAGVASAGVGSAGVGSAGDADSSTAAAVDRRTGNGMIVAPPASVGPDSGGVAGGVVTLCTPILTIRYLINQIGQKRQFLVNI